MHMRFTFSTIFQLLFPNDLDPADMSLARYAGGGDAALTGLAFSS